MFDIEDGLNRFKTFRLTIKESQNKSIVLQAGLLLSVVGHEEIPLWYSADRLSYITSWITPNGHLDFLNDEVFTKVDILLSNTAIFQASLKQLMYGLTQKWDNIPLETIQRRCECIPRGAAVGVVLAANGYPTCLLIMWTQLDFVFILH
uniref:Uncharacterized protein n=1 Tax=Glossina palpalis gambiensis TaxID=67801 RepID=A0A1B0BY49_9MUSC